MAPQDGQWNWESQATRHRPGCVNKSRKELIFSSLVYDFSLKCMSPSEPAELAANRPLGVAGIGLWHEPTFVMHKETPLCRIANGHGDCSQDQLLKSRGEWKVTVYTQVLSQIQDKILRPQRRLCTPRCVMRCGDLVGSPGPQVR
jgi:hypothetical protein